MTRPSDFVDGDRLWSRIHALARHGARADGGVDRQALSDAEIDARAELVGWAREHTLTPYTDAIGNLFLAIDGADPDQPPIMCGSHIDSQPTGGRYDGVFGVVAALEAVVALKSAAIEPPCPIEVVAWMNEEGSRFAPGMTGSSVFSGVMALDDARPLVGRDGVVLGDALDQLLARDVDVPVLPLGRTVTAFVEPHIEQGPILEREGVPVGIVTGIQGTRRYRVRVSGEAGHAGTTPRAERRDALMAAARMITGIDRAAATSADTMLTVGMLDVTPNAPSVIPSEAYFSIDLRHPDNDVVDRLDREIRTIVDTEKGACAVELSQIVHAPSLTFDPHLRQTLHASADALSIDAMNIYSAAGHDARQLHYVCPTAMLFVPCRDGVSHHPSESAEKDDLVAATKVLADALVAIPNSSTTRGRV